MARPDAIEDVLEIDFQLVLRAPLPGGLRAEGLSLRLPDGTALAMIVVEGAIEAPLPGWVWTRLPKDAGKGVGAVVLELWQGETATGLGLTLPRAKLRRRIEEMCRRARHAILPVGASLALEHVLWGGLGPELTANARSTLRDLAGAMGLAARVAPILGDPPPLPGAGVSYENPYMETVSGPVLAALQAGGDGSAALARAMQPLSFAQRVALAATLTDPFCAHGQFATLWQMVAERQWLPALRARPELRWSLGLLPHLRMAGKCAEMVTLLDGYRPGDWDGLSLPCLTRAIGQGVADTAWPAWQRVALLEAFLRLLERGMGTDGHPFHGAGIRALMIRLMAAARGLPDPVREALAATVLRHYTLCPPFWTELARALPGWEADWPTLPPAARTAAQLGHPDADICARALDRAEGLGAAGTERFRIERLGPAGMILDPGRPLVDQLAEAGRLRGDVVMRLCAHPEGPDAIPPALVPGLKTAGAMGPRAEPLPPLLSVQARAGDLALRVLDLARDDPSRPLPEGLKQSLIQDISALAVPHADQLGLGLGLSLWAELDRLSAAQMAEALRPALTALAQKAQAHEKASDGGLWQRPALVSARLLLGARRPVPGLPQDAPEGGSDIPATGLFNTVVTLISCRPNLDTRVATLRASWIAGLEALGVPCLVMVGGGDGTRRGDVVHLDAPDDYEGLPQKVLAAADWIRRHTGFGHMLKIDDDCYLSARDFFAQSSYRRFAYHGRNVARQPGQMSRDWHWEKSRSLRGRHEFDRSGEPSVYADGGSSYTLSRGAMTALAEARSSAAGQRAELHSFLEDKLVGDLLAQRGIAPRGEGYVTQVKRRPGGGRTAVTLWRNAFAPGPASLTHQVHMDHADPAADVGAQAGRGGLWPRKIWPAERPAGPEASPGPLELLTPPGRLAALRAAPLVAVGWVDCPAEALPDWLRAARGAGLGGFLLADPCTREGTLDILAQAPDVTLFSAALWAEDPHRKGRALRSMMGQFRHGVWSLLCQPGQPLAALPDALTTAPAGGGNTAAQGAAPAAHRADLLPLGPQDGAALALRYSAVMPIRLTCTKTFGLDPQI